jgi:hypothetical protein
VVSVPLGLGIGEFVEAIRDRVEVSGRDQTWHITAGSFDSALAYAHERFDDPVVLSRRDRHLCWMRVTLEISTDPARAQAAPPVEELARPVVPQHRGAVDDEVPEEPLDEDSVDDVEEEGRLPASLEAMFARQAARRR